MRLSAGQIDFLLYQQRPELWVLAHAMPKCRRTQYHDVTKWIWNRLTDEDKHLLLEIKAGRVPKQLNQQPGDSENGKR